MTELLVLILILGIVISFGLAAILTRREYGHIRGHSFGAFRLGLAFGFFIFFMLGILSFTLYGYFKGLVLFEIVATMYFIFWNPGHKTDSAPEAWECYQCCHKPKDSLKLIAVRKDGRIRVL